MWRNNPLLKWLRTHNIVNYIQSFRLSGLLFYESEFHTLMCNIHVIFWDCWSNDVLVTWSCCSFPSRIFTNLLAQLAPVGSQLVMGLGPGLRSWVTWFLLLKLPIVGFALSGVVFCLDFDPFFFFLLLFPCQVFFSEKKKESTKLQTKDHTRKCRTHNG